MSDTFKTSQSSGYRHKLLATASAGALLGMIYSTGTATAADADRPLVWVELGGQLSRTSEQSVLYVPPFAVVAERHGLVPIETLQSLPRYVVDGEGAISFQPEDSDWMISASIRYGRSSGRKHKHQEIEVPGVYLSARQPSFQPRGPNQHQVLNRTADYGIKTGESHLIIDFQAGNDVGLGLLEHSQSQLSFGIRMAQFSQDANFDLRADPYPHLSYVYFPPFHRSVPAVDHYQFYKARPEITRNFRGIGPSLSWQGSSLLAGSNGEDAALDLDWSANVALLFGRQKMRAHHATTGDIYTHDPIGRLIGQPKYVHNHYAHTSVTARSHTVTVPDVGGSVGFSLKFPNAKVSFGYRADLFFNAIDGGIDAVKKENRGFYGPYASISIGFGD